MVAVAVRDHDIFDVAGVEAQLPDVLDHEIEGVDITGVDEDETVTGVDEVGGGGMRAHKIEIAEDSAGLDVAQLRLFFVHYVSPCL